MDSRYKGEYTQFIKQERKTNNVAGNKEYKRGTNKTINTNKPIQPNETKHDPIKHRGELSVWKGR